MFSGQNDAHCKGAKHSFDPLTTGFSRRHHQGIQIRAKAREGALEKKRRGGGGAEGGLGAFGEPSAMVINNPMDPWSFTRETPPNLVPVELLPTLVTLANSHDLRSKFQGVLLIRKLLAVEINPPIEAVIQSDVATTLVECMTAEDLQLQFEASWALSNIASGSREQTHYIIEKNVVPLWIQHLSSPSPDCQEQATWAIGNIAGEGATCRNFVLDLGVMQPLLQLIQSPTETLSLLQSAVWALSNLCRFKPLPLMAHMEMAVPVLANLILHPDLEISLDAIWALSYICDGPSDRVQLIIDSGVIPTVVAFLSAEIAKYHMPAIRIIGNICASVDRQTQVAINAGALGPIRLLLDPQQPRGIRKEAAWTLSNIGAGTVAQIQALINADLVPILISTVGAYEPEVKKEAIWVIANITTNGNDEQIEYLVTCNSLEALALVLGQALDYRITIVALEAISTILENGHTIQGRQNLPSNPYADRFKQVEGDVAVESLLAISANATSTTTSTITSNDIVSLAQDILVKYYNSEIMPMAAEPMGEMGQAPTDGGNNNNNQFDFWSGNDGEFNF